MVPPDAVMQNTFRLYQELFPHYFICCDVNYKLVGMLVLHPKTLLLGFTNADCFKTKWRIKMWRFFFTYTFVCRNIFSSSWNTKKNYEARVRNEIVILFEISDNHGKISLKSLSIKNLPQVQPLARPLVLDAVTASDTFEMYLYWNTDTFFMENVFVYLYILCCHFF